MADERPDHDERAARLEARRHMGASRSRWTPAAGWTTPPEDRTPQSPRPRGSHANGCALPLAVLLTLALVAGLLTAAETAR